MVFTILIVMKKWLFAMLIFCACNKDRQAGNQDAPSSGMYASAQYNVAELRITRDVTYSVRPNAGNAQYSSDLRKASERGSAQLQLMLDIAVPPNATAMAKQPLVVVIHGGAYTAGSKEDVGAGAISYARLGYVVASINYRLTADNATSPQKFVQSVIHATEDGMNAIRFLKSKAAEYNIDTTRVATVGASAGGGISLINAISFDALPGAVSDFSGVSSKVQAALSTGATLVQPGIPAPQTYVTFDRNDSPVLLFNANPVDGSVGTTWNDHVLPTQKLITGSGNECVLVAQPDKSHTVDISPDGPYWKQCRDFLWTKLRLSQK
jgi:poly(3-hydroxybutyrate) depolymerase